MARREFFAVAIASAVSRYTALTASSILKLRI
jgi:hypothetical protein